jgi:hypothetical protein
MLLHCFGNEYESNVVHVTSEITPPAAQRHILNLQPHRCEDLTSLNSISVCAHAYVLEQQYCRR